MFNNKRVDKIIDDIRKPTWNVPVKAVCACGEEVTEEDMDKQKYIYDLLLQAREHNVSLETVAKEICSLFEDCPAEPERWKPKEGEEFCFITHAGYVYCENYSDKTNEDFWEFGNCFKTREETEQARDKVKEVLLDVHRRYFNMS